jgi:hypothetical protein
MDSFTRGAKGKGGSLPNSTSPGILPCLNKQVSFVKTSIPQHLQLAIDGELSLLCSAIKLAATNYNLKYNPLPREPL